MRILCFGDSNTYGYDPRSFLGGRYPADSRWVDILAELTGWEMVNGGENGREVPKRSSELERFDSLLLKSKPDRLIIMLGGNDLLQGATALEVAERMKSFLLRISPRPEQMILITPPPMKWGAWVTDERLLTESVRLAEGYARIAEELSVAFLNAGDWEITLAYDGVHFDEEGHRKFARQLQAALLK